MALSLSISVLGKHQRSPGECHAGSCCVWWVGAVHCLVPARRRPSHPVSDVAGEHAYTQPVSRWERVPDSFARAHAIHALGQAGFHNHRGPTRCPVTLTRWHSGGDMPCPVGPDVSTLLLLGYRMRKEWHA